MNIGKTLVASAVAGLVLGAVACGGDNKDPNTQAEATTSGSASAAGSAAAPAGSTKAACGAK